MEHNPSQHQASMLGGVQQATNLAGRTVVQYQAPPEKMPVAIAKAVIVAIAAMQKAQATGDGEDVNTARQFKYTSVNDVLDAAHDALITAGLAAIPVEVSYSDEIVQVGALQAQLLARYGYQFRLVHSEGASWIDPSDTRHISIFLPTDGKDAGKAQTLAIREYLKGLLRIRTADPNDVAQQGATQAPDKAVKQPRETKRIPPKGAILFEFENGLEPLIAKEIEDRFHKEVAIQPFATRKAWEEANERGLEELNTTARPAWLRIRKVLDRE